MLAGVKEAAQGCLQIVPMSDALRQRIVAWGLQGVTAEILPTLEERQADPMIGIFKDRMLSIHTAVNHDEEGRLRDNWRGAALTRFTPFITEEFVGTTDGDRYSRARQLIQTVLSLTQAFSGEDTTDAEKILALRNVELLIDPRAGGNGEYNFSTFLLRTMSRHDFDIFLQRAQERTLPASLLSDAEQRRLDHGDMPARDRFMEAYQTNRRGKLNRALKAVSLMA